MFDNDTIAAISTPFAVGGIGIVRVSGDNAKTVVSKMFRPFGERNLLNVKGFNAIYGRIFDNNGDVDEVVVTVYNNPKSYTGEDVVEISCHGGLYITKRILRACLDNGARIAEPGEFTKRAFLSGKMTLTQAEAVMDVISSQGGQASKAALSAMDGAIFRSIKEISDILISIEAHLTAWVDYPEEGVEDVENEELREKLSTAREKMIKLLDSYDAGKIFKNGVETAIVGRPNVGKSTLMNMLSGSDKSIVTDIPGTTRDIVEDTIMLGDIVLNIADTAGLRETKDTVEAVGVKLAKKRLENSYFVIAVFDSSALFTQEDKTLVDEVKNRPCVAVINKTDLERKMDTAYITDNIINVVEISADSGEGKLELSEVVKKVLGIDKVDASGAIVANERQRVCLKNAQKEVTSAIEAIDMGLTLDAVNVCVDYAVEHLMSLTGEKASEAIINEVFSAFCVGK